MTVQAAIDFLSGIPNPEHITVTSLVVSTDVEPDDKVEVPE